MRSSRQFVTWCLLFGAAAGFFCLAGPSWSQDLKKAYDGNAVLRDQLFTGDVPANGKNKMHARVAEISAEYFILSVGRKEGDPEKLRKEFSANITKIMDKKVVKNNLEFRKIYGSELVRNVNELLSRDIKDDPSATIHTAMMLPIMARLKQEQISAYLVKLVEGSQTHDGVRLYALKALKDTMPIEPQQELFGAANTSGTWIFTDKDQNAKRAHDIRNVEALTKYIERLMKTDNMSRDGLATLRYLRREAIISLAAAGTPAVYAFTKPPAKDVARDGGLIAPTLLKVLIKGAIQPEPTIQEKIEAALGLCAMDYTNMPEYQPEPAIYLVGLTIAEFARDYNADWGNFSLKKGQKAPYVAWKIDAKRFQAGLTQLKDNARGNATAANLAGQVQSRAKVLLDKMEKYGNVDQDSLQIFINDMAKIRPKNGKVFKTLSPPELKLP